MNKLLTTLICLSLLTTSIPAVAAPANVSSNEMTVQIEGIGSVNITDDKGKSVSVTNDTVVASGSQVTTDDQTNAWIKLDDDKVVGLDAKSEAVIKEDKKSFDVKMNTGNMFFDVNDDLKIDKEKELKIQLEDMDIFPQKSFGIIMSKDDHSTEVLCLDGSLEVSIHDPVKDKKENVIITSGEALVVQFANDGVQIKKDSTISEINAFAQKYLDLSNQSIQPADDVVVTNKNTQYSTNVLFTCANGHDYIESTYMAPTCITRGCTTYSCKRCGATYNGDFVEPLGHLYDRSKNNTYTNEEYHFWECRYFGYCGTYSYEAHIYDDGYCTVCDYAEPMEESDEPVEETDEPVDETDEPVDETDDTTDDVIIEEPTDESDDVIVERPTDEPLVESYVVVEP